MKECRGSAVYRSPDDTGDISMLKLRTCMHLVVLLLFPFLLAEACIVVTYETQASL